MAEFTMPALGADMDEGTLQEWLVHAGDPVHKGDMVAVVETAKSTIEVECFETGKVGQLLVSPGTTVPVGTPLARIEPVAEAGAPTKSLQAPGEPPRSRSLPTAERARPTTRKTPRRQSAPRPAPAATPPHPDRDRADAHRGHGDEGPLVRHLAERAGIDLDAVHGSGRGGRVTRTDVERAAAAARSPARVTPYARRLARELGVDLGGVMGSGGTVRASDVRAAPGQAVPSGPEVPSRAAARTSTVQRKEGMRESIAGLMARANREIPHYYLSTTIDLATAMQWMHEHNRQCPVSERLLPAALLLKAAARAAREVPELNGYWIDGHFTAGAEVRLGVAVSLRGGGLIAPVLRHADILELPQLMVRLKDLVTRARVGRLRSSEVSDPTLTVTNLGDQGVEEVLGVVYPPQVALVGFGRVVERPWAVDGLLGVRPIVTASLSADHRATDGAVGARYLTVVDRLLQSPEEL
ncbi:2-oxo acid dehydrogenase subunit E2 [Streptomyces sp. NPDC059152]|uniref:2-oxo acid dehydrogenase subunit E2 n=1 Tax=Streptomyces sp. NPDC059152 TaxID=3346742 RepID=UPI0036A83F98